MEQDEGELRRRERRNVVERKVETAGMQHVDFKCGWRSHVDARRDEDWREQRRAETKRLDGETRALSLVSSAGEACRNERASPETGSEASRWRDGGTRTKAFSLAWLERSSCKQCEDKKCCKGASDTDGSTKTSC